VTNYRNGRRLEYLARDELQGDGYVVIRSAGSHGPVDLIAWNAERVRFIQVKAGGAIRPKDRATLAALVVPAGASVELWERAEHGFDIRVYTAGYQLNGPGQAQRTPNQTLSQ
jgi:Holliday junction resolvase-like predicted endonuclease